MNDFHISQLLAPSPSPTDETFMLLTAFDYGIDEEGEQQLIKVFSSSPLLSAISDSIISRSVRSRLAFERRTRLPRRGNMTRVWQIHEIIFSPNDVNLKELFHYEPLPPTPKPPFCLISFACRQFVVVGFFFRLSSSSFASTAFISRLSKLERGIFPRQNLDYQINFH